MKIVLAIEGGDGTGKSTLAKHLQEACHKKGYTCSIVGREVVNSSTIVGNITDLLKKGSSLPVEDQLVAKSDILIRIAREYQRAFIAKSHFSQIVLLDRFVISILSRVHMSNLYNEYIEQQIIDIVNSADLKATIFCDCPFDIAWARVIDRAETGVQVLSPKEQRGAEYNRELFRFLKEEFERGKITGEKWKIDTSLSLEDSKQQLEEYISRVLD